MLTGKFTRETTFPTDDMRHAWDFHKPFPTQRLQRIEAVRQAFAGDVRTLAQIALGWIWARSDRTVPIPGFKNTAQVKENIQAMEYGPLSRAEMNKIEAIFGRAPDEA
jgi:aryl-alcohol dehydrogenase-like predicted oxidoreductase